MSQGELAVMDLTMRFQGLAALDGITATFRGDEVHGVIGPNGSGKTTLFNVMSGFYRPSAGQVVLRGTDVTRLPPNRMSQMGLSRTFQTINLFRELTILENVLVGMHRLHGSRSFWSVTLRTPAHRAEERRVRERARELLAFVGLDRDVESLARELPYGQQRLLEIARALAAEPNFLLVDEPAAGLNPTEVDSLCALLGRIRDQGMGLVVIEHHMRLIMAVANRVTCLDHGKIIATGTPAEVANSEPVLEAYLGRGGRRAQTH